jgi:ferredoxin
MTEGFDIVSEWLEGLSSWMEAKGYWTVKEMTGIIIDKVLKDHSKLPLRVPQRLGGLLPPLEIVLNKAMCIDCGWCEKACMNLAIETVDELPRIDKKKCEVCGLCEAICPVHALRMQPAR